jgi:glyoxylase-like metal-dependent hydrolase (beta-lactamase superfamily II)
MTDLQQSRPGEITITGTRQHEAWQQRLMPPVEQLAADLWSIPVPIPHNPLRYVSAYAFATQDALVLLDTGWDSEESWEALVAGLRAVGAAVTDVRGVLVTHMHLDHLGLAGRLRAESGAWLAMHPADHAVIARPDYRDAALLITGEARFLRSLGATAVEAADAVGTPEQYAGITSAALPDRSLSDGELADVPGWKLRAVHTPGHTPGHLCFVDEQSRRLFAGDHVLPRITPNISVGRAYHDEPLDDYLAALAKVRDLDVGEIFPAHEWRFRGLSQRTDAIAAHHEHRLAELLAAVRRYPRSTPWELAARLTWSRPWDQYHGRMRIFAVTETAAHLQLLVRRGLAVPSGSAIATYLAVDGNGAR